MKFEHLMKLVEAYIEEYNRETHLMESLGAVGINIEFSRNKTMSNLEEVFCDICGEAFLDYLFSLIENGYVTMSEEDEEGMIDILEEIEDVVKAWMDRKNG